MIESHDLKKRQIYDKALVLFGIDAQLQKLAEECCELSVEAFHMIDGRTLTQDFLSEIADVEILCEQMRQVWGDKHIDAHKATKLKRLAERLENKQPNPRNEKIMCCTCLIDMEGRCNEACRLACKMSNLSGYRPIEYPPDDVAWAR